jgi:hypothetical protein
MRISKGKWKDFKTAKSFLKNSAGITKKELPLLIAGFFWPLEGQARATA